MPTSLWRLPDVSIGKIQLVFASAEDVLDKAFLNFFLSKLIVSAPMFTHGVLGFVGS